MAFLLKQIMISQDDLIALINYHDNPTLTEFFQIDVMGLDKYVKPETDILSLIMLSKARNQGLDIVFVDDDKFFDGSFKRIVGELLNGTGPFEGAFYIEFELSPVLLHGKNFSLIDHSESMGFGVNLESANLTNELINHYLKDTGKVDYGDWQSEDVETVQQLADYINRMLTTSEPKEPWHSKLPSLSDISLYLIIVVFLIGFVIYFIFKNINRLYQYINYWLNKPI